MADAVITVLISLQQKAVLALHSCVETVVGQPNSSGYGRIPMQILEADDDII